MPCSRHQALLPASSSAAETMTASSLAPADQARPRAGLVCTSSRQRSNVCTETPTSFATALNPALSGGNNLATALFLNASPYRAIVLPYRPQDQDHIEAATILTRGAGQHMKTDLFLLYGKRARPVMQSRQFRRMKRPLYLAGIILLGNDRWLQHTDASDSPVGIVRDQAAYRKTHFFRQCLVLMIGIDGHQDVRGTIKLASRACR